MAGKHLFVAVGRLELHIPEARSLKAKRAAVRPLVERIRARHQVLVIEADHQDLHQRATLAVCAFSSEVGDAEERLQRVGRTVDETFAGLILGWTVQTHEV